MIVISIMCRVIFSEYYFKDHIGNKCTLVCFNVSSLVRLHACSLLVCSCIFVILLNKLISYHIISVSFGRDTKIRWSLLSGVYARGSKISHTGGKMCNLSWTPHYSLDKDNSLNHSCVSPRMDCLEYTN